MYNEKGCSYCYYFYTKYQVKSAFFFFLIKENITDYLECDIPSIDHITQMIPNSVALFTRIH